MRIATSSSVAAVSADTLLGDTAVGGGAGTCAATCVVDVGAGTVVVDDACDGCPVAVSVPGAGRFASDSHGGGAHARGASTAGSAAAVTAAWRDPSTVVVLGCGASGGAGSTLARADDDGRTALEEATVALRGAAGSLAGAGGALNCRAAACGAAACGAEAAGAGAGATLGEAPGFMLGSSHSPQYRHFTAAS